MFGKLFCIFCISCIFAFEKTYEDSSIAQVVMHQPDSVENVIGQKVYLKKGNVFHTNSGYVICNGLCATVVENLSLDTQGYFLECRSAQDFRLKCSNPSCGYVWWFSETWEIYCPRCGAIGN